MKRILSLILVACMLLGTLMLVGCPAPDDGTTTTTKPNGSEGTPSAWKDSLDTEAIKADIAGETLTISAFETYDYEIFAEEDSKDALDQLIYKRNKKIEERFGITIATKITTATGKTDQSSHFEYAKRELQSREPEFDLLMMMAYQSGKLIASGHYRDWRSNVPYAKDDILAGSEWWPSEMNRSITIKGRQFLAFSDMCITAIDLAYGMLFNQTLMTNNNVMENYNAAHNTSYETIYDMVDAGAWTLDVLIAMTKDFWIDNEADQTNSGVVDQGDVIGFYGDRGNGLDSFTFSFGFSYIMNDGVSDPTIWSMPATFDTAVTKLTNLFYETKGATLGGMQKPTFTLDPMEGTAFFAQGNALFKNSSLSQVMSSTVKGMTNNYGLLPYPKLDADQVQYLTGTSDNVSVLSIPWYVTKKKLRMAGAVTVALSAETNKSINYTYYEMIVKHDSGFDNRRSVDMVDKIVDGRRYDLSCFHLEEFRWSGEPDATFGLFMRYLLWNRKDASSMWDSMQGSATSALSQLIRDYARQR